MSSVGKKHCICMISDFFYPNTGGIETHIYHLSQHLIQKGHKVIGITHSYNDRICIRYYSNYFKVYYLPFPCIYLEATLPLLVCTFPLIRDILIREEVTIIHGHGAFSGLCGESMIYGSIMGIHTVFTDHSLFGFADLSSIITNKFLQFFLSDIGQVICVSYTSKENTVLRASLDPDIVSVIPNAVEGFQFTPDLSSNRDNAKITIVIVSRLVLRKGVDFIAAVIPIICHKHPDVHFLIAGDGPKRVLLEEVREKYCLQHRVKLTDGMVPHSQILVQGDIYLNASITEAFCMVIVEASCCGLQVVSTNVGGVPEVLPPDLILLADPDVSSLVEQLEVAISNHRSSQVMSSQERHTKTRELYTWSSVTEKTEQVYNKLNKPNQSTSDKLLKYYNRSSTLTGVLYILGIGLIYLVYYLLEWVRPSHLIDRVPDQTTNLSEVKHKTTKNKT